MQSDDLFLRKMRGPLARPPLPTTPPVTIGGVPSPPPSPGGAAPRQRSSSEAALGRPPEDGEGSLGVATPRTRAQSHEEAAGGGSSPTPPRFRDPLLLLGLAGTGSGEGGDPDSFPRPPWSPLLAHYDVQSILFDPTEPPPGPPSLISGASAAHLEPEEPPGSPGVSPDPEALVLSCPRFCCETGGEQELGLGSQRSPPGPGQLPNAAVAVLEEPPAGARPPHPIEHSDEGAEYYRKYFYGKEHQNLLGEDPRLGPVAVSLRREEKEGARPQVLHRIILRTCQARTLRGSVLEESLPPGCRPPGTRGVPTRKLLELLLPGLAVGGLRLAPSPAVQETLLKLDEQGVSRQRKVGVLYCRAGQGSEEDMYNNEGPGPALEQFLDVLGTRVRLRGFGGYRAQLDTRTDSTGTHSLYTTYHGYELMFHVSTMLPFTPSNRQQLLRKRHIGNDIVTIVFQEPGALPFSPRALRSHFQHVFIVVRVHEPCSPNTSYSVAVVRPDDTPPFGPPLEKHQLFLGVSDLRPFLLAKAINGENAAARGGRLGAMAARTRRQYLHELLRVHGGGPALPAPPRGLPTLGGLRRGGSGQGGVQGVGGGAVLGGALVWGARLEDGEGGSGLPCLLGVATERIVLVAAPAGAVANRGVGGVGVVSNSVKTPQTPPNSAHPGETPREGLVATREGSVATRECSVATREGSVATREGSVATREGSLAHREGSVATREGSVATREGSLAHGEGSVATREGSVATREGSLAHREGPVATREGSLAHREGSVAHREGSLAPREGSLAPREGSLAPREGSLAPREGSLAHREGSVATAPPGTLFSCACRDVLGWGFSEGRLEIFHGEGEWIALRLPHGAAPQVVARLQAVTRGCEAQELALPRGAGGRRGFRVDPSGVVTAVTRFSFAETAGLRPGARLLRVGRCPLPTGDPRRLRELLRRPSGPLTLLPPDRDGRPRRSFSELYALSLQQGRGSGGDPNLGDPRGDIGDTSSDSGGDSDGGGEGGLSPQTLRLLDEERPPNSPPGTPKIPSGRDPSPPPLADPTPDLLLPHHSPPPAGDPGPPPDPGTPPERHPLGRLLSGSGDPQEDEWDVIAGLATACSGVLEAIARGGHQLRELPNIGVQQSPATPEDESQSLSEKVAQLEAALKRLQDDLQEEAQQRLRSELLGLRRSARRLQQGQEEPKERLSRNTRLLRPPGTPESPLGDP